MQLFVDNPVQKSLRVIKENGHFMRKAVESENLKETLKYTDLVLSELRTESLSPKEYYTLFNTVFDELAWLHPNLGAFLKTRQRIDIFEIVQYSKKIVPRLYLMIVAGLLSIENGGQEPMKVFWDIFKHLKGVQHPLRGLMLRYYFLKAIKETIEDKEDELVLEEVVSLFLMNMREMNSLWVRINTLIDERDKRIRQRKDLAMLVGENLMRLSALEGLDVRLYRTLVFPKVIEIILDTKDRVSQEYLFDCLISVFPDDFHLETLSSLLEATERLGKKVEINGILMKLMERLALFAKNNEKFVDRPQLGVDPALSGSGTGSKTALPEGEAAGSPQDSPADPPVKSQYHRDYIYHQFKNAIGNMISREKAPVHKLLELLAGFMNFTVFFYNGNFEFIDAILKLTKTVCDKYRVAEKLKLIGQVVEDGQNDREGAVDPKALDHLVSVLTIPMEKLSILVLKLTEFTSIMNLLPDHEKRQVALKICGAVAAGKTYLVTEKVVVSVLQFIHPLFAAGDTKEEDIQQIVKMLHFIDSGIPALNVRLLQVFEHRFCLTDRLHLRLVFPVYLNRLLFNLAKATAIKRFVRTAAEEAGVDLSTPEALTSLKTESFKEAFKTRFCRFKDAPYLEETDLKTFDIEFQADDLGLDVPKLLEQIHQITTEVEYEHPMTSLSLWLDLMLAIDTFADPADLDELLYNCSTHILTIFENETGNSNRRLFYFGKLLGYYGALRNANPATLENIFAQLRAAASLLLTREEQARAILKASRLYLQTAGNNQLVAECVHRSLALIKMSLKYETVRSSVVVDVFEYLNLFVGGNLSLFEVREIEGCLAFIEKSLEDPRVASEEAASFRERVGGHLRRSQKYWSVHSPDPEVQKLLTQNK